MKQASLGVLLIVAALLTACSSEDKAQPEAVSREQPKTWKLCIQANKTDSTTTRGLYLDGSVLKSKWGDTSTSTGQTVEVWRGDSHLGNLTASASNNGSTVITGELTGTFTKDETLTLYSPSKTRDYSGQTGTIESMSAKDYVSAEITVTAVDGSNGVLATSEAAFLRLQSFNKFTVTPAVHSLQIAAEGMATVTATLAGTADGTEFYVALPNTGGSAKSFTITGTTYAGITYRCNKSKQLADGTYYTASMTLLFPGALPGKFTINGNGDKVYFSKGNLQAKTTNKGSSWTWSFAAHQWDYIGGRSSTGSETQTGNNFINGNGTVSANGTVDLFGWSTSSTTLGIHNSTSLSDPYTGDFADWGDNSTVQSGIGTGWRTLTRVEWLYVFNARSTTSGVRFAKATVNGVSGVILLPDDWSTSYYSLASTNTVGADFNTNSISSSDWSSKFEAHGAVFLPAAGDRSGTTVRLDYNGRYLGAYWTSTAVGASRAAIVDFSSAYLTSSEIYRGRGCSVRLVRVAP